MAHHAHGGSDKGAAYTGLVVGAVVLFLLVFGIVKLTNNKYAHEAGEKPAAEATH